MRRKRQDNGIGMWQYLSPSKITLKQKLSDGNYLSIWFRRRRVKGEEWQGVHYLWTCSVYVGTLKDARIWAGKKTHDKITGNGTIEALRLAKGYILGFCRVFVEYGMELQINASDAKRYRAYKFLMRYDGFQAEEETRTIHYRNPKYYEWVGKA